MKVLGIIAEFNPLHKGHEYLLLQAREKCRADYTIVIMSGNFTQRGEPAIFDKFIRTRWALACGADAVLELPAVAATASAKDFARTGVSVLAGTGVVSHLAFGCENASLPLLDALADFLMEEPPDFRRALKEGLKSGLSWPAARSQALSRSFSPPDMAHQDSPQKKKQEDFLSDLLKQPNNILALEYLMALKELSGGQCPVRAVPVQRVHSGYHDESLDTPICSATALRRGIIERLDPSLWISQFPETIRACVAKHLKTIPPVTVSDFSQALGYRLMTTDRNDLQSYLDIDRELGHRIADYIEFYTGFEELCRDLSVRSYTATRVRRGLLHILLGIRQEDRKILEREHYAPYLRLLGFRKESSDLLSAIKKQSQLPIITRPARALEQLESPGARRLFNLDAFACALYDQTLSIKSHSPVIHEFRRKIITFCQ